MAFKDALKDISDMFASPEVGTIVSALSQARQPAGGRVAENLSVPFGLTFEQGSALRGEASTADAYADARRASEKAAAAEAQRVALEGRRVAEGEKSGEHDRAMNDLSRSGEIAAQRDAQLEVEREGFAQEKEIIEGDREYGREMVGVQAEAELKNARELQRMEEGSPMYRAQVQREQAETEVSLAQAYVEYDKWMNGTVGALSTSTNARRVGGQVDANDRLAWINAVDDARGKVVSDFGHLPDVELQELMNQKSIYILRQGYELGVVDPSAFEPYLASKDYEEFAHMHDVWTRAKRTGDLTEYLMMQQTILDDLVDDARLNESDGLWRPDRVTGAASGAKWEPYTPQPAGGAAVDNEDPMLESVQAPAQSAPPDPLKDFAAANSQDAIAAKRQSQLDAARAREVELKTLSRDVKNRIYEWQNSVAYTVEDPNTGRLIQTDDLATLERLKALAKELGKPFKLWNPGQVPSRFVGKTEAQWKEQEKAVQPVAPRPSFPRGPAIPQSSAEVDRRRGILDQRSPAPLRQSGPPIPRSDAEAARRAELLKVRGR